MNYTKKSFSVPMGSPSSEFADRWEQTFGKKSVDPKDPECDCVPTPVVGTSAVIHALSCSFTAEVQRQIESKNRRKIVEPTCPIHGTCRYPTPRPGEYRAWTHCAGEVCLAREYKESP